MAITVTPSASGTPAAIANGFAAGTLTFSNLNGGTNFPTCTVCVFVGFDSTVTVTSPKIGSVTATQIAFGGDASGGHNYAMLYADVPSGTADNFSFTNGSNYNHVVVIAWQLSGAATGGPSASGLSVNYGTVATPMQIPSAAIIVPSGGVGIIGAYHFGSGSIAPTWTNTTAAGGDQNTSDANNEAVGAHTTATGSQSVTITGTGFTFAIGGIMAAWAAAVTVTAAQSLQPWSSISRKVIVIGAG